MNINIDSLSAGDSIPELVIEPITRSTLALYAGASGDHNPMHIDIDFAKQAGMDDVFAHGMLIMAYLGRSITNIISPSNLKSFSVRFCSITTVGDVITCKGEVMKIENNNPYGNAAAVFTTSGQIAKVVSEKASAGMVGINIGVPVPRDPYSFGGWNESKYGHGDITGKSGVEFWTNLKKVTSRWPESEEAWKKYF